MKLKEHVRGELLLCKELLTKSEFSGNPAEDERIAHDIIIADDAAEIAMGAICSQLGGPDQQRRASVSDYFSWLQARDRKELSIAGSEYCHELHKTRMDLQCRFIVPELYKWRGVRETVLGLIARWCQDYLRVQVWNVQWQLAGMRQDAADAEIQVESAHLELPYETPVTADDERRISHRYECEGTAEIRVPAQGRLIRGRIVNLSFGGCYIETSAGLDVGTRIEIVLRVSGLAFRAAGQIRSVYGAAGVGIQFTGMSAGGRSRLKELIGELEEAWFSAGMPSEASEE